MVSPSNNPAGLNHKGSEVAMLGAPVVFDDTVGIIVATHGADRFEVLNLDLTRSMLSREQFEILDPNDAEAVGLRVVPTRDAVEGQKIACSGGVNSPPLDRHAAWNTFWFSVGADRTLCALCPACGTLFVEGG